MTSYAPASSIFTRDREVAGGKGDEEVAAFAIGAQDPSFEFAAHLGPELVTGVAFGEEAPAGLGVGFGESGRPARLARRVPRRAVPPRGTRGGLRARRPLPFQPLLHRQHRC